MTGKIRGIGQTPGTTRIKGSFMTYYSPHFQRWIIKAWPKGNGGDTPRRKAARERFITATQVIKDAAPEMWEAADEWAKNSPYLARDILMACAMGTFIEGTMADGSTKVSLTVANANIQQLLDSISTVPGAIVVNTDDGWVALLPGLPNQVLTIDPITKMPDWATPTGGGGGDTEFQMSGVISASFTAEAHAAFGNQMTFWNDETVTGIGVTMGFVAGATYEFRMAPFDTASLKMLAASALLATFTAPATQNRAFFERLATPYLTVAGTTYVMFVVRTDGTTTPAQTVPKWDNAIVSPGIWITGSATQSGLTLNSKAPTTADVWSTTTPGFAIPFTYKF